MVAAAKALRISSLDDNDKNALGPVQNPMPFERVKGFVSHSKSRGYKFATGEADAGLASSKGFFVQPTIIDNPPNDSRIIQEEPFGPIVPTQPWSDLEEVIARANDTKTGLGACVWGPVEEASKIPQALFGGHKESGIGAEWGKTGLLLFCNPRVLYVYKS
ncbi:Aldehyde/histidinol dehydrogenase [Paraphoma chrysanthemicola]|nr:Aldehyde/histidinol dehydrogenase [Paraphoma chrysanthemicola]